MEIAERHKENKETVLHPKALTDSACNVLLDKKS